MSDTDPFAADDAVVRHYARVTAGLPPPCEPHPGYATLGEAYSAHRRWLEEQFPVGTPQSAPTPEALPDPGVLGDSPPAGSPDG